MEAEKLDDVKETAAWTGLPASWWYAAVAAQRVPFYKIGKYVKFRRSEVQAWLEQQRQGPKAR
jgi:excisionase family DNA binding protein